MKLELAIAAVVVIIIIVAGGYLLTRSSTTASTSIASTTVATTTTAQTNTSQSTVLSTTTVGPSNSFVVKLASNATFGTYLVNATGYTLYTYSSDVRNSSTSSCTGSCQNVWPPFYPGSLANLTAGTGLNISNFGIINRTGSRSKQVTYKGWPLYFYVQDTRPGMITGNGVAGFQVATK